MLVELPICFALSHLYIRTDDQGSIDIHGMFPLCKRANWKKLGINMQGEEKYSKKTVLKIIN